MYANNNFHLLLKSLLPSFPLIVRAFQLIFRLFLFQIVWSFECTCSIWTLLLWNYTIWTSDRSTPMLDIEDYNDSIPDESNSLYDSIQKRLTNSITDNALLLLRWCHHHLHQKKEVFHKRHLYHYNLRGQSHLGLQLNLADYDYHPID